MNVYHGLGIITSYLNFLSFEKNVSHIPGMLRKKCVQKERFTLRGVSDRIEVTSFSFLVFADPNFAILLKFYQI